MKKKKTMWLWLLGILFLVPSMKVSAIDKNVIDPDNKISIPSMIWDTGSKVSIYDTENYSLYYQWREITMEQYNTIESINKEGKGLSNEANEYVKNNRPKREDYETLEEYNAAVEKLNSKIAEYNTKIDAVQERYYEAIPNYVDSKWTNAENDTVYLPEEAFTGTRPFVLYVKLEDHNDNTTSYEVGVLKLKGSEEGNNVSIDNDEDDNVENPSTGDMKIVVLGLTIFICLSGSIVAYKKVKKN